MKAISWELEWVRVEDGVPTEAPNVAGGVFRLRRWLLALILAIEGPLVAATQFAPRETRQFIYCDNDNRYYYGCGCGLVKQWTRVIDRDSTLLVRRAP